MRTARIWHPTMFHNVIEIRPIYNISSMRVTRCTTPPYLCEIHCRKKYCINYRYTYKTCLVCKLKTKPLKFVINNSETCFGQDYACHGYCFHSVSCAILFPSALFNCSHLLYFTPLGRGFSKRRRVALIYRLLYDPAGVTIS